MLNSIDAKELKKMYKALIEINDIGKNMRSDRSDYVLIDGMIIVWKEDRSDSEFFGNTIAILSKELLEDLGPLAHIPLYINGDTLGAMHTKHKISTFYNIEPDDGCVNVIWYDDVTLDESDILDNFIESYNASNNTGLIDKFDVISDIMVMKKFKEYKDEATKVVTKIFHKCTITVDVRKTEKALRYMNKYVDFINSRRNDIIYRQTIELDDTSMDAITDSNYPLTIKFDNGFTFRVMKSLLRAYRSAVIKSYIEHVEFSDGLAQNIIIMNYKRMTVASSYTCIPIKSKNE